MSSIKTFIGVGTTKGILKASTDSLDVVLNGSFYEGASLLSTFSHQQLITGIDVDVTAGQHYQIIINAAFADDAEVELSTTFNQKTKKIVLTGDAEPPGMDFEIGQFHIYA